jgi:hypothetical protein
MDEKEVRRVGRRGLLRSAGAVAAGVAGGAVAGAVAATPAAADQGQPVLAGLNNTETEPTRLQLTGGTNPNQKAALRLSNTAGPALTADPVDFNTVVSTAPPAGSVFVDTFGDFWTIGDIGNGKYINPTYSPTWATMPVAVASFRWLDTRGLTVGNSNVVPGSANFENGATGRVIPKGTDQPDLVLDFSELLQENYVAVQANVTIIGATNDGWIALWGDGPFPGPVSVNFLNGRVVGGFTQTELTGVFVNSVEPFGRMKMKVTHRANVIVDVVGFITPDIFSLFAPTAPEQFRAFSPTARIPKVIPRKI